LQHGDNEDSDDAQRFYWVLLYNRLYGDIF
jgi:hypothetical protein